MLCLFWAWKPTYMGNDTRALTPEDNKYAFIKNVGKSYSDVYVKAEIEKYFPKAKTERLTKEGRTLNTLKIEFPNEDDLKEAINIGKFKIGHVIHTLEEPITKNRLPFRCNNCNTYHKCPGRLCKNETKCEFCSESHTLATCPSKEDNSKAKCVNCHNNHPASDTKCPIYIQEKNKLNIKNG